MRIAFFLQIDCKQPSIVCFYPAPKTSTYKHNIEVGRIRQNLIYGEYGLDMIGAAMDEAIRLMSPVCPTIAP